MHTLPGSQPPPAEKWKPTPYERAVVEKLDFLCEAAVSLQHKAKWCAWVLVLMGFFTMVSVVLR